METGKIARCGGPTVHFPRIILPVWFTNCLEKLTPTATKFKNKLKPVLTAHDVLRGVIHTCTFPLYYFEDETSNETTLTKPELPVYEGELMVLQSWYDIIFPSAAAYMMDYEHIDDQVEFEPLSLDIHVDQYDVARSPYIPKKFGNLKPILRTMQPTKRPCTATQTLLGFAKRNGNVPRISVGLPAFEEAEKLYENFVNSYVIDIEKFHDFRNHTIDCSTELLDAWYKTQDRVEDKKRNAYTLEQGSSRMYNFFSYMVKGNIKPPVVDSDANQYPGVQTIAFQPADVMAVFGPLFVEMRKRLVSVLDPKVIFYSDMNLTEFATRINAVITPQHMDQFQSQECDVGKYDKSMALLHLLFEKFLYYALGLPTDLCQIWFDAHVVSTYSDRHNGLRFTVNYQRRSGDPATYFGNTVVNMAATAATIDLRCLSLALFAGDDNYLLGDFSPSLPISEVYANVLNFEAKSLTTYKWPYFCGKFIVHDSLEIKVLPDPVRIITKLGRRDLRNYEHAEQYRVSTADLLKQITSIGDILLLNDAVMSRYPSCPDNFSMIQALISVVQDREKFLALFELPHGEKLCMDPSLPSLEI